MKTELPKPECALGYTHSQIEEILGQRTEEFWLWMSGQTVALCNGTKYDYQNKAMLDTGCGPHGGAVYPWDLQRFLDGLPIID